MEIFILRHGHAEAEASCDKMRELSPAGVLEVTRAVNDNIDSLGQVAKLLVSPYIRAQQTAGVVKSILADVCQETCEYLKPNACPKDVVEYVGDLFAHAPQQGIMLVGHQPLLGILLDQLCGLEPGRHRLATASMAAIDFDVLANNCCDLRWVHHVS